MSEAEKQNGFEMTAAGDEEAQTPATESAPMVPKRPKTLKDKARKIFQDNALMITTLIGVVIGFAIGFAVRPSKPSAEALLWLGELNGKAVLLLSHFSFYLFVER